MDMPWQFNGMLSGEERKQSDEIPDHFSLEQNSLLTTELVDVDDIMKDLELDDVFLDSLASQMTCADLDILKFIDTLSNYGNSNLLHNNSSVDSQKTPSSVRIELSEPRVNEIWIKLCQP